MTTITEADVEQAALDWLEGLGPGPVKAPAGSVLCGMGGYSLY